jgi:hypothetical protein
MVRNTVHSVTAGNDSTVLPVLVPAGETQANGMGFEPKTRKVRRFRVLTEKELDAAIKKDKNEHKFFSVIAINALKTAREKKDPLALAMASAWLRYGRPLSPEEISEARSVAARSTKIDWESWDDVLMSQISHILSPARLIYWFEEGSGQLKPALYCPNPQTAIAVQAIHMLLGGVSICPHDQKVFTGNKQCCSFDCREAHRVARHRAKQRAKEGGR